MYSPTPSDTQSSDHPAAKARLRVDVIADFACPWSYLGKRRLERALESVHGPYDVRWYPFQINPALPAAGALLDKYLASHFGSSEGVTQGLDSLKQRGAADGIDFRFDRIQRVPNTLSAHRLMYLAESLGRDTSAIAEDLMRSFFTEGADIASPAVLTALGEQHGLDAKAVSAALENRVSRQQVLTQEAQMRRGGVSSVPALLVNRRLFITGVQDVDTLVNVFDVAVFGTEEEQAPAGLLH